MGSNNFLFTMVQLVSKYKLKTFTRNMQAKYKRRCKNFAGGDELWEGPCWWTRSIRLAFTICWRDNSYSFAPCADSCQQNRTNKKRAMALPKEEASREYDLGVEAFPLSWPFCLFLCQDKKKVTATAIKAIKSQVLNRTTHCCILAPVEGKFNHAKGGVRSIWAGLCPHTSSTSVWPAYVKIASYSNDAWWVRILNILHSMVHACRVYFVWNYYYYQFH